MYPLLFLPMRETDILPAFIVYEHVITIAREIQCVWQRRWTGVSVLLVCNRYLALLLGLLELVDAFPEHAVSTMLLLSRDVNVDCGCLFSKRFVVFFGEVIS